MYPDVNVEMSIQKYVESHKKRIDPKKSLNTVLHLTDLQKSLLYFANKTLSQSGLSPVKLSALLPCVVESYGIYQITVAILKKLAEAGTAGSSFGKVNAGFAELYPVLQKFMFNASTIPYLSQNISVPNLPKTAPTFKGGDSGPPPKQKKAPRKKKRTDSPKTSQEGFQAPPPTAFTGSGNQYLLDGNIFANSPFGQSSSPFGGSSQALTPFGTQQNSFFPTASAPAPAPAANPFASTGAAPDPFASMYTQTVQNNSPFDVTQPQNPLSSNFTEHVAPGESREELLRKNRELEARIKVLEGEVRDRDGQISELKTLLNERDSGVAQVRVNMEQRLQEQQQQFMQANAQLKSHLETMVTKYEKEKLSLLTEQIDFSKNNVDQTLFRFDDPNHLGNRGATGEDILRGISQLEKAYEDIIVQLDEEGDVVGASRVLSDWTTKLLDDAKGASNKIEDSDLRLALTEGTRDVARTVSEMLSHAKQLAPEGRPDEGQLVFLRSEEVKFGGAASSVKKAINDSFKALEASSASGDLDGLAERELLNAAKTIEDAAAALKAASAQRKAVIAPGELDVEGAIMDAAMAITTATQLLVVSATQAQQERVRKGQLSGDAKYHRDPMWTEGLISAAKSVAESVKLLVSSASKVVRGEIDDASLIAAARSVAASTAQLVSATRAKSDGSSESQAALDRAAAAVTRATRALVDAAKSFQNAEEMEMLRKSESFAGNVRAEIEANSEIIRLEKGLDLARKKLKKMRNAKYDEAHKQEALKSPRGPAPVVVNKQPVQVMPQQSSSTVDRSSGFKGFGKQADEDEDDVNMPSYMNKVAAAPKRQAAPPNIKDIPKVWQNKKSTKEPVEIDTSPAPAPAPAPTPAPAPAPPTPAAPAPAPAAPAAWNPFDAPPATAAPATAAHNPFM
eukprot:TRINITY_DN3417_c0_g1_i1.p1 TRINITY_DN3417_c0_g1~~TRINITY_DN3417_c0_g1_i1.p1  ORF type:complete len:1044 (-),score=346.32 TRINITY_DN3417_c0_g1_i1:200-2926(-)